MKMSKLLRKNLFIITLVFSAILAATAFFSAIFIYRYAIQEYKSKGLAIAESIAGSNTGKDLNKNTAPLLPEINHFLKIKGVSYVFITDKKGELLYSSAPGVHMKPLKIKDSGSDAVIRDIFIEKIGGVLDIAFPVPGGHAGYVHVGMNKNTAKKQIAYGIAELSAVLLLIFSTSGFIIYRYSQKHIDIPLQILTAYSKKLVEHDYSAEMDFHSSDEFDSLASAMQYLAIDIQGIFERFDDAVIELEKNRAQLQDTLSYLSTIIDTMADGLLVTDTEGIIIRVNRTLLDMFGLKKDDTAGKNIRDLFSPETATLMETSKNSGRGEVISAEIRLPMGKTGKALATAIYQELKRSIRTGESLSPPICIGIVILISDITKEKEIDQMKTDFISTVSHELRTPLTSILGFAKIIKKKLDDNIFPAIGNPDGKTQKAASQVSGNIGIIVSEGERLTSLINNLLDIAKMEAGKVEWKKENINIAEIIKRAVEATASLIEQRNIKLIKDIEDGLPDMLGDRDKLVQAVINLISNAIKFTDSGTITCRVRMRDNEITVSIIDTGIGIALEDLGKVFDKFKQIGDTLTDKPKGTGLGLPICKQIIEHHGGRIWVESEPASGSSFSFALPINTKEDAIAVKTIDTRLFIHRLKEHLEIAGSPASETAKTILIVDDDGNIRNFLKQTLESEGYMVEEAEDGLEAIRKVKEKAPNLVILDVMMPNMSGFDVAAVLKNDPVTMDIPIIILSVVEDKNRGYRIGVDRYLTKPVNMNDLLGDIEALLSQGISRKKVLVVDEDESTVKTLTEMLEKKGYTVVCAYNGGDCISKAKTEMPDMIIIDAFVSNTHGIVKALRFEKGFENVFFILLGKTN